MVTDNHLSNGSVVLGDAYHEQDEADAELAFQVQHAEPGSLDILSALVERYAGDVMRLAQALLTQPDNRAPSPADIQAVAGHTFTYAVRHPDRFRGEASLKVWLLRITIRQTAIYLRHTKALRLDVQNGVDNAENDQNIAYWSSFDKLSERHRLVLILHYLCGLNVEELADIYHVRAKHAHASLVTARRKLLLEPRSSHRAVQIEVYLDGMLTTDPAARDDLESHLPACEACDALLAQLRALDQQLRDGMQERWPLVALNSLEAEQFILMVQELLPARQPFAFAVNSLRKVAWTAAMLILFITSALYMILNQGVESEFPALATPTVTSLPKIIGLEHTAERSQEAERSSVMLGSYYLYTYALSEDAGVFALVASGYETSVVQEYTYFRQIYLHAREDNFIRIVDQSQGEMLFDNWLNSPPSLSADGRYLAYNTHNPEAVGAYGHCQTAGGIACNDIFVLDQQTGATSQVTHGLSGEPADGDSFGVQISADGRWVAFWSLASNLSEDDSGPCEYSESILQHCLDIFLVEWQSGTVIRVPLGAPTMSGTMLERISLSSDGRLVSLTVGADDELGSQLGVQSGRQVVLYDRGSGAYELVNQTPGGSAVDGTSFGAVLSADGRFVAFSSLSPNLVAGDTNEAADVFVLDRQEGRIERVSVGRFGEQGNGDSGVITPGMEFQSIDISADGRYVVFLTMAENFTSTPICSVGEVSCNQIMLHDRLTGKSEIIQPVDGEIIYLFPKVASDGRWVSYAKVQLDCYMNQDLCMEVVLYDCQRGWESGMVVEALNSPKNDWVEGRPLTASEKNVNMLALSQNGKYLAAIYPDKTIGIWDFEQEKWVREISALSGGSFTSLAFSHDGTRLAVGTIDGIVHVWEIPNGRHLYALEVAADSVHTVEFTPDGADLLISTRNEVQVWRRGEDNIRRVNTLEYDTNINAVALSPSGNLLAVASSDHYVWLQLLPSGTMLTRLGGYETSVVEVAFSKDGSRLASRSIMGEIQVWQIDWQGFGALGTEFINRISDSALGGNLDFSPDGKYLISGSSYQGILLWNIDDNSLSTLYSVEHSGVIINSIAFSTDGLTVMAGAYGAIDTWTFRPRLAAPRFFEDYTNDGFNKLVADGYLPMTDWPELFPETWEARLHLDLYQAAEMLPYDLLVATRLPEQVHFKEAQLLANDGAVLHYEVEGANVVVADLYLLIQTSSSTDFSLPIGADAFVEAVILNPVRAEYLQGDWVMDSATRQWRWDDAAPVKRLRWQQGNLYLSIFYRERPVDLLPESIILSNGSSEVEIGKVSLGLQKSDLEQLAEGVKELPQSLPGEVREITYTIQEGDTCYGIAAAFDTTVEMIASLNGLPEDCYVIYAGEPLMLVQNINRQDMVDRADLDCDGKDERLQVLPMQGESAPGKVASIYLRAISDMGIYQDAWKTTASAEGVQYLAYPLLAELGECQNFLTFRVVRDGIPSLLVYRWQAGEMELVLSRGSKLLATDANMNTLTILEQVTDAANGVCQAWQVTLAWDGKTFTEVGREESLTAECFNEN